MVGCGPPCEDMSRLRLLPPRGRHDKVGPDARPGLNGPKGQIFRQCTKIMKWILKYNPKCKFLFENVDFSDMEDHWNEINAELGVEPIIIDSANFSYTRRTRAFWTNIALPEDFAATPHPLDCDTCLDPGRSIIRDPGQPARTIGKSWRGDPPVAYTRMPVLIRDEN